MLLKNSASLANRRLLKRRRSNDAASLSYAKVTIGIRQINEPEFAKGAVLILEELIVLRLLKFFSLRAIPYHGELHTRCTIELAVPVPRMAGSAAKGFEHRPLSAPSIYVATRGTRFRLGQSCLNRQVARQSWKPKSIGRLGERIRTTAMIASEPKSTLLQAEASRRHTWICEIVFTARRSSC